MQENNLALGKEKHISKFFNYFLFPSFFIIFIIIIICSASVKDITQKNLIAIWGFWSSAVYCFITADIYLIVKFLKKKEFFFFEKNWKKQAFFEKIPVKFKEFIGFLSALLPLGFISIYLGFRFSSINSMNDFYLNFFVSIFLSLVSYFMLWFVYACILDKPIVWVAASSTFNNFK